MPFSEGVESGESDESGDRSLLDQARLESILAGHYAAIEYQRKQGG